MKSGEPVYVLTMRLSVQLIGSADKLARHLSVKTESDRQNLAIFSQI